MPLKSEETMRLENRLAMKVVAQALEGETQSILARQKMEEKAQNSADAHTKAHIQILAYKFALETVMESGKSWRDAEQKEKDQLWVASVQRAVEKLRNKGHKILDKHIPKLKETIDLGRVDLESGDRPIVRDFAAFQHKVTLPPGVPRDVWDALHKLWDFAVDKPGYDKERFVALEAELTRMAEQKPIAAG